MSEYIPLLDGDDSFIPEGYWEDEIIADGNGKACFVCGSPSEFYNITIDRHECEIHTKAGSDKENT